MTAIPEQAIPLLIECTPDANDGLRMNATMALRFVPAGAVLQVMQCLVAEPNSRVSLIAASSLLSAESDNTIAGPVLLEAPGGPARWACTAALEQLESLGGEVRRSSKFEGMRRRGRGARIVGNHGLVRPTLESLGDAGSCLAPHTGRSPPGSPMG